MRKLKFLFTATLLALTLLWVQADHAGTLPVSFIAARDAVIQYSGLLAYWMMSLSVILATRLRIVETFMGGLDRVYRVHKWMGIAGLILAVLHWIATQAPKWAGALGLLSGGRPPRGPRPEFTNPIEQLFMSWRGVAEEIGEAAFYIAIVLIVIALVHRVSYRLFAKSHRLFPIVYLALVFHAVVLIKFSYWTTPIGILTGALTIAGVVSSLLILFRRVGKGRTVTGVVAEVTRYEGARATRIDVDVPPGWSGHKAGQFAFLTVPPSGEAHPFTIATDWNPQARRIGFVVKELGDHTRELPERIAVGASVTIEGPYGRFLFDDGRPRQIWIGGGIGIVPFIARLRETAAKRDSRVFPKVVLFHTTTERDEAALARLAADAAAAGVELHVIHTAVEGRLSGDRIRALVPDWREAGFWFCGPERFADEIKADLARQGFDVEHGFHQELFAIR